MGLKRVGHVSNFYFHLQKHNNIDNILLNEKPHSKGYIYITIPFIGSSRSSKIIQVGRISVTFAGIAWKEAPESLLLIGKILYFDQGK